MNRKFNIKDLPKLVKSKQELDCQTEMVIRLAFADSVYLNTFGKKWTALGRDEVKKHCIVSYVSAIEVFCKTLIVRYHFKWSASGYGKLLDANISLNEAYNLFKEMKVSRASIISHYYSFQNLNSIAHIFDILTNKKIFNEIENLRDDKRDHSLIELNAEWRSELAKLFELRHRIIHEVNWKIDLKDVDVKTISPIVEYFCSSLYMYCRKTKTFNTPSL